MRPIFVIIIILLLSTACSAQQPQATVTPFAEVTVTLPPPTVIPTPTLHPQFAILQDQIAASGRFALLPDGRIEETTADGGRQTMSGLSVDKNGEINLLVNGEELVLNSADVIFDEQDGVKVKGYEFDEKTGNWLPVAAEQLPVKEYPMVEPKDFLDCVIPLEDLYPQNGADMGEFARWAATKAQPFTAEQLDKRPWTEDSSNVLHPDPSIDRVPGTVTVHMGITTCVVEMEGYKYIVTPFELPDPSDPTNPDKNIQVIGFGGLNYIKDSKLDKPFTQRSKDNIADILNGKIKIFPMITGFNYPTTSVEIPLAKRTWDTIGAEKMAEIIARVKNGDIAALQELKGMPVMIRIADNPWYK
jgi:hypothetical protein